MSIISILDVLSTFCLLLHCITFRNFYNHSCNILMMTTTCSRIGITRNINRITPFSSHDKDRIGMHSGTNQWIHLSHVATQPANRDKKVTIKCYLKILRQSSTFKVILTTTNKLPQLTLAHIERFWLKEKRKIFEIEFLNLVLLGKFSFRRTKTNDSPTVWSFWC